MSALCASAPLRLCVCLLLLGTAPALEAKDTYLVIIAGMMFGTHARAKAPSDDGHERRTT